MADLKRWQNMMRFANIVMLVALLGLLSACSGALTESQAKEAAQKKITQSLAAFSLKDGQLSELTALPAGDDKWYFVRFYKARPDQIAVGVWVFRDGRVEIHGEAPPGAR